MTDFSLGRFLLFAAGALLCLAAACGGTDGEEASGDDRSSDRPPATERPSLAPWIGTPQEAVSDTLPAGFGPICATDGSVRDVVAGGDMVVLGGAFTSVRAGGSTDGGVARTNIAACSLATGEVLDWYPGGGATGEVVTVAADDRWVYLGGDFTTVGGVARAGLARVDLVDATVDARWDPDPNRPTDMVVPAPGGFTYVGGNFERIAGDRQPALARLDDDGRLDERFRPVIDFDQFAPAAFDVAPSADGELLYVGGKFSEVNGEPRTSGAAIDQATGTRTAGFAPDLDDPNPDDPVVQVVRVIVQPEGVYLCGDWWVVEGAGDKESQHNLGRFDASTGVADRSFFPTTDGGVQACALGPDGETLLIGGHYDEVNGQPAAKLAALGLDDGGLRPFPTADSVAGVWTVRTLPDGRVLLGGDFSQVGGEPQPGLSLLVP